MHSVKNSLRTGYGPVIRQNTRNEKCAHKGKAVKLDYTKPEPYIDEVTALGTVKFSKFL